MSETLFTNTGTIYGQRMANIVDAVGTNYTIKVGTFNNLRFVPGPTEIAVSNLQARVTQLEARPAVKCEWPRIIEGALFLAFIFALAVLMAEPKRTK